MKKFIACILATLGLTSACGQKSFQDMNVGQFANLIANSNIVILDVRTADEFNEGHISGAINVDVLENNFLDNAKQLLPTGKTIAVYCRSGKRSANASGILSGAGYNVVNLLGGIMAWKEADMPLATSQYETDNIEVRIRHYE